MFRALVVALALALLGAASRADDASSRPESPSTRASAPAASFSIHDRWLVKHVGDGMWVAHFGDVARGTSRAIAGGGPSIVSPGWGEWILLSASNDDRLAPGARAIGPGLTVGAVLGEVAYDDGPAFAEDEDLSRDPSAAIAKLGLAAHGNPRSLAFDDDAGRLAVSLGSGETLVLLDAEPHTPEVDPSFEYWVDGR